MQGCPHFRGASSCDITSYILDSIIVCCLDTINSLYIGCGFLTIYSSDWGEFWDIFKCILNTGVYSFQGVLNRRVSLYTQF